MSVESQVNNIADLNPTYPQADDPVSQGDNHIRNIKKALKDTFPNIDGTVTASEDELNQLVGQDLPSDVGALEARVTKNEGDIANNASGIANNASDIANNASGIANNASGIANNAAEIATKADKSYVDSENSAQDSAIAQKADKSYVDSQNSAQDSVIAQKADKSYVDAQDSALSSRISSLEGASHVQSLDDLSDVSTAGAQEGMVLAYIGGQWVPLKMKSGGGMIKPTQQPQNAGDFYYNPKEQAYMTFDTGGDTFGYVELTVPAGKVFSFEYLAAYGNCILGTETIEIDGVTISGGTPFNGTDLDYDSSGGPTWPGNEGFNPIRVESSLRVRIKSGTGQVYVSGVFTEE